jgi:hypothetical protein
MIYMQFWELDKIHHAAFNETAKCTSLHTSKYALKYTPDFNCLYSDPSLHDLHSKLHFHDFTDVELSIRQSFHRLTVCHQPKATHYSETVELEGRESIYHTLWHILMYSNTTLGDRAILALGESVEGQMIWC